MLPRALHSFVDHPARSTRYVLRVLFEKSQGQLLKSLAKYPIGRNVLDLEWDVLVILDTCRIDALRATIPEVLEVGSDEIKGYWSLGSQTGEWLCKTFPPRRNSLSDIAYASGNAWIGKVFDENEGPETVGFWNATPPNIDWDIPPAESFGNIARLWGIESKPYTGKHDPQEGAHCPPAVVTDQALHYHYSGFSRVIAHYIQPHSPYEKRARDEGRERLQPHEKGPRYIKNGGARALAWNAYLNDLRWVLESVAELVENVDGTVAITADHGDAFGEYRMYGHQAGVPHPHMKRVPWIVFEGEGTQTREGRDLGGRTVEQSVEEQLQHLGYR